ncbi:MAG: NAD(P)H-dependent glycerol-3-phosphate dehydrogenase [Oscillospiraceae bacterium]|nr:NAD(P)-dependent glycerol-3-phosphate dehydrogenase [Subdoligranulum sp.]MDY5923024.1 NAD(P)H-dependent glycerol-3-phosphate dehydrogenase [Oscillospiraceae bacterium]
MANIGVLGAGTWGTALARMLAVNGHNVTMWSALPQELIELKNTRKHKNLPGCTLPESISYTPDIHEICQGRDILLFAVPSPYVRTTARACLPHLAPFQVIVDVAKGIEAGSLMTMSQVIQSEVDSQPGLQGVRVVALSGPTHAEEVALDLPTAIVASSEDMAAADKAQDIFMNPNFRVYTNNDVIGVELGGAVKNIIALGCGIACGLGYGDNARAALITRGAAEISRLAPVCGGSAGTIAGLAGIGDLIVTCTSVHSRNFRAGVLMGQGKTSEQAVAEVGMVVEGLNALPGVKALAAKYHVEMPIVNMVDAIVSGHVPVRDAVDKLMGRRKTTEFSHS